jgi:hypothetical protein
MFSILIFVEIFVIKSNNKFNTDNFFVTVCAVASLLYAQTAPTGCAGQSCGLT